MNENETLVNQTENVEQTTEQTPPAKIYTEDEVNAIVGKKKSIVEAKLRKEYDRRYGELESVLKAGMGKEDMGEITNDLREFYGRKGVKIEKKPEYSAKDIETLARAEAEEFIRMGDDEVAEEVDRLSALGAAKMSAREKEVFKVLAKHRQNAERSKELSAIGVTEDVYNSREFREFAGMFKESTPITKIYENYVKTQPKKEHKIPGSMKNTSTDANDKDYYSFEEASKFTKEDFDKDPNLFKKVKASMAKWKR